MESKRVSDSCCQSHIDVAVLNAKQRRVLITVLVINATTFLMMVTMAALSGSSSLLSGALDNLGDAATYLISLLVIGASVAAKARVALFKGILILSTAIIIAFVIAMRLSNPETPVFQTMGVAAFLNLAANLLCLWLLTPYRNGDVNMSSSWECSRNDVSEGLAVIAAAIGVWIFDSGWPDLVIAIGLLVLFLYSAVRVLRKAWQELYSSSLQK